METLLAREKIYNQDWSSEFKRVNVPKSADTRTTVLPCQTHGLLVQIVYKADKHNQVADATAIQTANREDEEMLRLQHHLQQNQLPLSYSQREDMMFFPDWIMVLDNPHIKQQILQTFHSSLWGGHGRVQRTYRSYFINFFFLEEHENWYRVICGFMCYLPTN